MKAINEVPEKILDKIVKLKVLVEGGYKGEIAYEITPSEYADPSSLWTFHSTQFKLEKSKMFKDLKSAYVQKHKLWGQASNETRKEKVASQEQYDRLISMQNAMEDVSYYKQLK